MTRRLVQLGVMAVMVPSDVHGVTCCLSDHRSGVIFAVVVVCQQKQQWQLQQQEWRPWENVVWTNMLLISFLFKRASGCVCSKGHAGVIVLET